MALQVFTPIQISFVRVLITTLAYVPFLWTARTRIRKEHWLLLFAVGFFGSLLPNVFFGMAQRQISSAQAGIINSLTPLFTFLVGMLVFGRRQSLPQLVGVLTGLLGVGLLIAGDGGFNAASIRWLPFCVGILAPLAYSLSINLVHSKLQGLDSIALSAGSFSIVSIPAAIGLWLEGGLAASFRSPAWAPSFLAILGLAIVGSFLASIFFYRLVQETSALFASTVSYIMPIVALLLASLGGEKIGPTDYAGLCLILLGMYLVTRMQPIERSIVVQDSDKNI